jgi:hypothetical protein
MHQVIEDGTEWYEPVIHVPADLLACEVLSWPVCIYAAMDEVLEPLRGRGEVSVTDIMVCHQLDEMDRAWLLMYWLAHLGGDAALARLVAVLARWACQGVVDELMLTASSEAAPIEHAEALIARRHCETAARAAYAAAVTGGFVMPGCQDERIALMRLRPRDVGRPSIGLAQQSLVQPMGPVAAWEAFAHLGWEIGGDGLLRCISRRLAREVRAAWRARHYAGEDAPSSSATASRSY